jgi:hypothetical protein
LRDLLELLERAHPGSLGHLYETAPDRLKPHANLARLHQSTPVDTVMLEDAEELLSSVDYALSGRESSLEVLFFDLVAAAVARGRVVLKMGDFASSVQRLQPMLERPFVGITPEFSVSVVDDGLRIDARLPGRPKGARLYGQWILGAVRAIERFVHDPAVASLSSSARYVTDRIELRVRYGRTTQAPQQDSGAPTPVSVRTRTRSRPGTSSLAEVEKILGSQPTLPAFKAVPSERENPPSSRYSVTNPSKAKRRG